jgi:hypothetical protein
VECGINPDYFLDRMQWYEVDSCLGGLRNKEKTGWEQTRFLGYITAQTQSTKQLKPTDILSFDWDNVSKETTVTNEDKERLKEKAIQTLNKL